ncbi:MAG: methylenetetrahydrofolate reductase C-terminal domain-containing protein [Chloroflexi bacterium]|nr:methylenetetrahydrofolate reductase C-terminal domain-containing protein [Chloroflexota bacterium]
MILALRQFLLKHPRLTSFLDRVLRPVEHIVKVPLFDCHMCGQCVLHSTGMVCPMACPKNLRNGPCGGVRLNNHCEVKPEMQCVWVRAYTGSKRFWWAHEFHDLRPPVDWSIQGSASWVNVLTGRDQIKSGCAVERKSALDVVTKHAN